MKKVTLKTGRVVEVQLPVTVAECGSCGHYHLEPLQGGAGNPQDDCRFDGNRYTAEELDGLFGPDGW